MLKRIFFAGVLLFALWGFTDQVRLADGSVIHGEITRASDGKIEIKTSFAGVIAIDQKQVVTLTTESPVHLVQEDGRRYSGEMNQKTAPAVSAGGIRYLWRDGMTDPTLPQPRKWSGEFVMNISGKTGNTEKFNSGFGMKTELTGKRDAFKLHGGLLYDRDEGTVTSKKYIAGAEYEQKFGDSDAGWYAKVEFEKQPTSGLDLRSEGALGCSYYFISRDRTKFRGRLGITGVHKSLQDDENTDSMGAEAELRFQQNFQKWGEWQTVVTCQPTVEHVDDFRFLHESFLDIPMCFQVPLTLRIGIQNEYYSKVPDGRTRMDTLYFAKVVFKWK